MKAVKQFVATALSGVGLAILPAMADRAARAKD
jgi:hypothetical protein